MLDVGRRGDQVARRQRPVEACAVDFEDARQPDLRGQGDGQGQAGRTLARRGYGRQARRYCRVAQGGAWAWLDAHASGSCRVQTINEVNAPRGSWSTLGDPDHTAVIVSDAVPSRTPIDGQALLPSELHSLEVIEQSAGKVPTKRRYDLTAFSAGEVRRSWSQPRHVTERRAGLVLSTMCDDPAWLARRAERGVAAACRELRDTMRRCSVRQPMAAPLFPFSARRNRPDRAESLGQRAFHESRSSAPRRQRDELH